MVLDNKPVAHNKIYGLLVDKEFTSLKSVGPEDKSP